MAAAQIEVSTSLRRRREALELASTEQDRVDEYHAAVEAHGGDDTNVHMPKANIMMLGKGVWWWCCFCCVGLGVVVF